MLSGHGVEQSLLIADLVHAFSTPVVQKGLLNGRLGYLWLALRANQCRRKPLDQLWFFILCILFIVVKPTGRSKVLRFEFWLPVDRVLSVRYWQHVCWN